MSRIFLVLALFAIALLAVNIMLGLRIGDYHDLAHRISDSNRQLDALQRARSTSATELEEARVENREIGAEFTVAQRRFVLHFLFGLTAALVTVLVNSVSVTYFIGTNRWCREVVEAYRLDEELMLRGNRLKRRTFPWALGGIGAMLATIALGAACDPSRAAVGTSQWVLVHYVAALAGTFFIAFSFLMQVVNIAANHVVIDEILGEVARIRRERGLNDL